jgi:serpin B
MKRKKIVFTKTIIIFFILPLISILHGAPRPPKKEISDTQNGFAFSLYKHCIQPGANIVISPYSATKALIMAAIGSDGKTMKEINSVIGIEGTGESSYKQAIDIMTESEGRSQNNICEIISANRLWVNSSLEINNSYSESLGKLFNASIGVLEFESKPDESVISINIWISDATKNRINNMIPDDFIKPNTNIILTNAVYFLGLWRYPFNDKRTEISDFYISRDKSKKVPMMRLSAYFLYHDTPEFQILSLPYKCGETAMLIALPRMKIGLSNFEKKLTPLSWKIWLKKMTRKEVNLILPKFKTETMLTLDAPLKSMGIKTSFSKNADFSKIGTEFVMENVIQKIFITVNESGTEAVSATAINFAKMNGGPRTAFTVDHPFMYAIYDLKNGRILFLGRVVDPSSE